MRCARSLLAVTILGGSIAAAADVPAPTIRALRVPPPNAAGWNNTVVVVSFECRNAVRCPDDELLEMDGSGLSIKRVVFNRDGASAETEAVANIDRVPATVQITSTEALSVDRLRVTAQAEDAMSGVAGAWCNGRPATIVRGSIDCVVPLRDGFIDVIVTVMDVAGNSSSASTQLSRAATSTTLQVFPHTATIRIGEQRSLQLVDGAWRKVTSVTWTSDSPSVVVDEEAGTVTGARAGQATITAWTDAGTATMSLTVTDTNDLHDWTTLWTGHRLPSTVAAKLLPAPKHPPRMLYVEMDEQRHFSIASTSLAGEPLWFTLAAIAPHESLYERMLDDGENPILWLDGGERSAILRTGRPADGRIWRYECASRATGFWAMGWDRTLYVVERPAHGFPYITVLDSQTGEVKFRQLVPHGISFSMGAGLAALLVENIAVPSDAGPPTVPEGNEAAMPFTSTIVRRQDTKGGSVSPLFMAEREVLMLRLNAKRDVRVVRLAAFKDADVQALPSIKLGRVVPDGQGGLLTLMELGFRDGHKEGRVVRLVKDTKTTYPLPAAGEYALGPDQAFTTDGQTLVAFDPISGKVHWIRQSTTDRMWLDYATNDGGVVLHTARVMFRFNADGSGPVRVGPPQP